MGMCAKDSACTDCAPMYEAQAIEKLDTPEVSRDFPPMEELLEARLVLRKQAKSGHPARKAKALRDLFVLERIIADAKKADAKPEADA